jgi:hypothetical protein
MAKAVKTYGKLILDRHLRVVGVVEEDWVIRNLRKDFVECRRRDTKLLAKKVRSEVLPGCENMAKECRTSG